MLPSKGQFTLRRLTPTNRNRHFVKFYQIEVLPLSVSVGVGWCLFLPIEHPQYAFVSSWWNGYKVTYCSHCHR